MSIDAMKQALEALIDLTNEMSDQDFVNQGMDAISALRLAIEQAEFDAAHETLEREAGIHISQQQAEKQEPAPGYCKHCKQYTIEEPLPAPPQRQPLTDEQVRDLWSWSATAEAEHTATTQQHAFARAIERAHGIGGGE